MKHEFDPAASQTSFQHIDLSNLRELIGDAPDAELRLAELGLSITRRQTSSLQAAVAAADFPAAMTSLNRLRNTFTALNAERALAVTKAVEVFASLQDIAALRSGTEQLFDESELVCMNLAQQVERLKSRSA